MPISFTEWSSSTIRRLAVARTAGDLAAAEAILVELRTAYTRLGMREVGTDEEQNAYLLARHTQTPVGELQAVGINTNSWTLYTRQETPEAPLVSETEASPETSRRISDLFAAAGPLRAPSEARATAAYAVEFRPEDDQVHQGTPLPWAIVATDLDIAVAYHGDKELAEYQAERANAACDAKRGQK
ncbi:hypothetical protein ACIQ9R_36290 [Streptomyces sp. NPDC094447]|uniref:hypothetical protein n=1 Tax=Streptomyces sp. NPDC094447 TaxID=3366062 RepID=UPI0038291EC4